MYQTTQLQFKLMTPEAQRTAVQRLALRGMDLETICERTGLSRAEGQRYLTGPLLQRAGVAADTNVYSHWMRQPRSVPRTLPTTSAPG
jgi:hypothetical protein